MKYKIDAEVIADSINTVTGDRLTTFKVVAPRFILAEINTHRAMSRSWSSSRAIPAKKMRQQVLTNPVVPIHFGANQKGMQAHQELSGWKYSIARLLWLTARYPASFFHWLLELVGLHKQLCNRVLECWLWSEGVITATEWKNFFALRHHPDAQPEFGLLAGLMAQAIAASEPRPLNPGDWHLPFVDPKFEIDQEAIFTLPIDSSTKILKKISAARCARVSYYLRDGQPSDRASDLALCDRLAGSSPKHLSPFEHQAVALPIRERVGNFVGWKQHRKEFVDEAMGDYERQNSI